MGAQWPGGGGGCVCARNRCHLSNRKRCISGFVGRLSRFIMSNGSKYYKTQHWGVVWPVSLKDLPFPQTSFLQEKGEGRFAAGGWVGFPTVVFIFVTEGRPLKATPSATLKMIACPKLLLPGCMAGQLD